MTAAEDTDSIRAILARYTSLYTPSVIAEITALHQDLLATAERHGVDRDDDGLGWLATAAAEAITNTYRRPAAERTVAEAKGLIGAVAAALHQHGLAVAPPRIRSGAAIGVEPVPGGPRWGLDQAGLAVGLYLDSGWELAINQPRTPVHSIIAPATTHGAQEIASLVRGIIHGDALDPFRR